PRAGDNPEPSLASSPRVQVRLHRRHVHGRDPLAAQPKESFTGVQTTVGVRISASAAADRSRAQSQGEPGITYIRPSRGLRALDLREVARYRERLYVLVWRDVKFRYKQTVLGASWAIIQPFATVVVLSRSCGRRAGVPSGGVPYPMFSYAALVPWTFF